MKKPTKKNKKRSFTICGGNKITTIILRLMIKHIGSFAGVIFIFEVMYDDMSFLWNIEPG